MTGPTSPALPPPLPYGPVMTRLLPGLRRAFRSLNRRMAPAIEAGFGPQIANPVTGSVLVLHTLGHRSGLPRRAPLGYAIVAGRIVVIAGYGRDTHWFKNAKARPHVQVSLPGAVLDGVAEEITDPVERRTALRAVVRAEGMVGRLTLGDVDLSTEEQLDELAAGFPLLAIRPTAVLPGPFDPEGGYWKYNVLATAVTALALVVSWRVGAARGCRVGRLAERSERSRA